jgi:hypothetical protein
LTEFKPVYEKWLGNFLKGGKSAKYLILTNLARKLKYTINNGTLLRILGSNNVKLADEILQDIGSGFYIGWVKREFKYMLKRGHRDMIRYWYKTYRDDLNLCKAETVRNLNIFGIWMEIGKESVAAMKECVLTKGSGKVLKCFFAIDKPTLEDFKICAENNVFGNFRRLWKLSDKKNIVQIADLAYDVENTSFREFMVKKLRKRKIFYVADREDKYIN